MGMQRSKVGTVSVRAINQSPNQSIGPFYTAGESPVRLYVRNRSGVQIQLAFESNAVNGSSAAASSADRFELDEGEDITLYVAPGQAVYAIGAGQGRLSWHAADAPYIAFDGAIVGAGSAGGSPAAPVSACPPARGA